MANNTYSLIQRIVVGTNGAQSITFSNIPQNYFHLILQISALTEANSTYMMPSFLRINSVDSGYTTVSATYNGGTNTSSAYNSYAIGSYAFVGENVTSNFATSTYGTTEIIIPYYTNTSYNKTAMTHFGSVGNTGTTIYQAGNGILNSVVTNTAAVTSLTLVAYQSSTSSFYANYSQYSSFTLYGLTNS